MHDTRSNGSGSRAMRATATMSSPTSLPAMRRSKSRGRAGRPRAKDHSASRTSAPGPFFRIESMAFCADRSEEHTSELQSLMRISYAVFCLQKKNSTYANPSELGKAYTTSERDDMSVKYNA